MRPWLTITACLAALLAAPLWAGPRAAEPARAAWMSPIPAAGRAPLMAGLRRLMSAEARQDWGTVYRLRPELDRETESEDDFVQRWKQVTPATVLDFEPLRADVSTFAAVSEDEQVFEIMGCAQVQQEDSKTGQEGAISAHLQDGQWSLDGVHLLTDDQDRPEPCHFHPGRALLAAAPHRR